MGSGVSGTNPARAFGPNISLFGINYADSQCARRHSRWPLYARSEKMRTCAAGTRRLGECAGRGWLLRTCGAAMCEVQKRIHSTSGAMRFSSHTLGLRTFQPRKCGACVHVRSGDVRSAKAHTQHLWGNAIFISYPRIKNIPTTELCRFGGVWSAKVRTTPVRTPHVSALPTF